MMTHLLATDLLRVAAWTITSFTDVIKLGRENPIDADLPLSADVAVIRCTSESTGLPKVQGVVMTHDNVLATVSTVMTTVLSLGSKDFYLAYLPLDHILELAAENLIAAVGSSIGYGSLLTLTDTSNKIQRGTKGDASMLSHTLMAVVPAILDRVRDGVWKKDELDKESFESFKSGLIAKLLEKEPSLQYETNRYWNQITDQRYMFDFSEKEAEEVKKI